MVSVIVMESVNERDNDIDGELEILRESLINLDPISVRPIDSFMLKSSEISLEIPIETKSTTLIESETEASNSWCIVTESAKVRLSETDLETVKDDMLSLIAKESINCLVAVSEDEASSVTLTESEIGYEILI